MVAKKPLTVVKREIAFGRGGETPHRFVADLIGVPVAKAGVKGVALAREQRADLLQRRDLELMRAPQDHLPATRCGHVGRCSVSCTMQKQPQISAASQS